MLITSSSLTTVFTAYNAAFNKGMGNAPSHFKSVAMVQPSSTGEEQYGWLRQVPGLREWLGPRQVNNLSLAGHVIKNKLFESTISVPRTAIEDDSYGALSTFFQEMGLAAAVHPDQLVFALLRDGFVNNSYDGQFFFDTDHPVEIGGTVTFVSNVQTGAGTPWFLLDTSRAIKPLVYQERIPYELQSMTDSSNENVFKNDEFLYGVRARGNSGYGLWQLAFGSRATLNAANYKLARAAMAEIKGEGGRPLGVKPDTLIVPPSLESEGLQIVNSEYGTGGVTNEWKGTAKLIVTPWVI